MFQSGILGVDIGGVIIERVSPSISPLERAKVYESYLAILPVPEAFVSLKKLAEERFGNNIFLVSKASQPTEQKILDWLEYHGFYQQTTVGSDRIYFCRERQEKVAICQRLNITHFIDDRLEVLEYLLPYIPQLYVFKPRPEELPIYASVLARVHQINSWQEAVHQMLCA